MRCQDKQSVREILCVGSYQNVKVSRGKANRISTVSAKKRQEIRSRGRECLRLVDKSQTRQRFQVSHNINSRVFSYNRRFHHNILPSCLASQTQLDNNRSKKQSSQYPPCFARFLATSRFLTPPKPFEAPVLLDIR